jgi:hypothetical protein
MSRTPATAVRAIRPPSTNERTVTALLLLLSTISMGAMVRDYDEQQGDLQK